MVYLSLSVPYPVTQFVVFPLRLAQRGGGDAAAFAHSPHLTRPPGDPQRSPQSEGEGGRGVASFKAQYPRPRSAESSDCS